MRVKHYVRREQRVKYIMIQIVYGRLSIRFMRNAFEESVGSRLQKFGGSDNKELLQSFTSLFRDEYKILRGFIIDPTRDRVYVLHMTTVYMNYFPFLEEVISGSDA